MIAIQDLQFVEKSNSQVEGGAIIGLPAFTVFNFGSGLLFNIDTISGNFASAYQGSLVSSVFLDTNSNGFAFPALNTAGFQSNTTVSFTP